MVMQRVRSGRAAAAFSGRVFALMAVSLAPLSAQEPLQQAEQLVHGEAQAAVQTQRKVDQLDDETQQLFDRYHSLMSEQEELQPYIRELQNLIAGQEREKLRLAQELQDLEVTRRHIVPLMSRMVEVLDEWIALDTPFLPEERQLRVSSLRTLMSRTDVPLAEKFRRVIEAYRIEAEYGLSIEAYSGALTAAASPDESSSSVNFIRVGRVGLFYLSLDGKHAGMWDREAGAWRALPDDYRSDIAAAMDIAQKISPPDLIRLPLPVAANGDGARS